MTWIQSVILAVLQGVTELFPISSLGHSVVLTRMLGWGQLAESPSFVPMPNFRGIVMRRILRLFGWADLVNCR